MKLKITETVLTGTSNKKDQKKIKWVSSFPEIKT